MGSAYRLIRRTRKPFLSLSNPVSGTVIRLPLFNLTHFRKSGSSHRERFSLSRDPSSGPFQVLAPTDFPHMVARLNSGDHSWTLTSLVCDFKMFVFHRDRIVGVSSSGTIVYLNVIGVDGGSSGRRPPQRCIEVEEVAPPVTPPDELFEHEPHLVETKSGDLFVVHLYFDDGVLKTCVVYKLLMDSCGRLERVPVVSLGDESLFLGVNHSVAVLASDCSARLPNSIYYYRNGEDIQIFNLEDGSLARIVLPQGYHGYSHVTWMVPSLEL